MLETSSQPKTFLGVRFVLLGFDPINEHKDKVRSKLVECGGVDVGHYSPNSNCTHVIVDNIVYDNPICVAARNDAKTLVTALWVHHSFDVGMPVDATSVLYRPLKDLNGIPGAKSLIVCLTGYQRQDRDDVMTMVSLMGAQFSKPLVANSVTHLICYKFEGEKYELAKKIPRIKLVNHRWLEDCLRDWALLPEDNYNKSGYELEMLEAEARDSEDEAEDTVVKQYGVISMNKSPHNIKAGSPSIRELPKSEGEVPKVPLNFDAAMGNLSIPGNENKLDQALSFPDMYVSKGLSCQDACKFSDAAHGELNDQHHRTPDFKLGDDLTSNSGTTKSSPHSDEKLSYSRQTPWKSTLPLYVGDKSSNGSGSSKVAFRKLNVNDDFASTSFKMELENDKIDSDCVEAPLEGTHLDNGGESSGILPQKRTMDLSYGSTKSPKMSHDAKSSIMGSPSSDKTPKVKATSLIDGSCETSSHYMVSSDGHSPAKTANFNAVENSSVGVSPTKSSTRKSLKCDLPFSAALISESGQDGNANKKTPVTTFQRLRKSTLSSKHGIVDCVMEKSTITVSETVEPQIQHQDVAYSSPSNKESVANNSNNLDNLNFLKGGNNDLVAKPVRKKMLAQKTLGSRSKLSSANQKGSVYLDEGTSLNDFTVRLNAGDREKSPSVIKPDVPLPDVHVEALKGVEGKDGATFRDVAEDKTESMDEETEAPEEEDEYKLENVLHEEKAIGVQSTSKADTFMEEKSEEVQHVLSHSETCVHGDAVASVESTRGNERGKTVSDKISLLVESTSKGDGFKGKNKIGKRHPLGKTKLKTVLAENKTEAPGEEDEHKLENVLHEAKAIGDQSTSKADTFMEEKSEAVQHVLNLSEACVHGDAMVSVENTKGNEVGKTVSDKISMPVESTSKGDGVGGKNNKGKKRPLGKTKLKTVPAENKTESMDDETEAPGEEDEYKLENVLHEAKAIGVQSTSKSETFMEEKSEEVQHVLNYSKACVHGDAMASVENTKGNEVGKTVSDKISMPAESSSKGDGVKGKNNKGKKRPLGKTKLKTVPAVTDIMKPKKGICGEEILNENLQDTEMEHEERYSCSVGKSKCHSIPKNKLGTSSEMKENRPVVCEDQNISKARQQAGKSPVKSNITPMKINQNSEKFSPNSSIPDGKAPNKVKTPPVWFILSGHRFQRKEFQQVIKRLKGRYCRDSHHWSYQATHFIAPDPIRRTEKFFAAAASGRWILKTDYLAASNQEGRFLAEEPYEWYKNGLSEDGAINLEAPRKWRLLRERTGHGAFHGIRIIIYGECIAPPLDTLKRVVKAGDGTILATSPPYTRFLNSGVDFAIVSPGMPRVDMWVQEFLKHEIPCVAADYLVEYVCKPGYPLERHVLYNTHAWAEKSFGSLQTKAEEVVEQEFTPPDNSGSTDIPCVVCGSGDRGEVMLICGNQSGTVGCGVGTHIDCCNPPLEDVPEDDWLCPKCSQSKNSTNSSKKRKKAKSK